MVRETGIIPSRGIPKTKKIVLDAALLNTQHYKVSYDSLHLYVVAVEKGSFGSPLTKVTNFTIYILVPLISFQAFFVQAFKIVVDSWKFSILLLYILWDDKPILMISGLKEQLQQQLEYTLLKPDWPSWWISKMQSGREDTLEERYAIKFCFKVWKMPQKRMECFRLLLEHLASIEHQFLSGKGDSRKAGSLWGMMRGVGGVRKSEHQSWLAK